MRRVRSCPSSTAAVTPGGSTCRIWPFGPFTSTADASTLTVTPFGRAIGFFPIRDMSSPDVAENLAAHAGLLRGPAGHHALRGREDVDAQPADHRRYAVAAGIDAAARPADPLETGDHALAAGTVFQEHPDGLARALARTLRRRLDELVAR